MGSSSSVTYPENTFAAFAEGEPHDEYSVRRHPHFAKEVMGLPDDLQSGQDIYLKSVKNNPKKDYIGCRKVVNGVRENQFTFETYEVCFEKSKNFGAGLVKRGVVNETMVCIYAENRPEWILTADASYLYGYSIVALYDTFTTDALEFSIKNCGAEYLVVSSKNLDRLLLCGDDTLKQFKYIITFDNIDQRQTAASDRFSSLGIKFETFAEVMSDGMGSDIPFAKIEPEQLCYVCYSSGTTGFPKGVMISHRCFVTNLLAISYETNKLETFETHLCYLPLCHVFERMCTTCTMLHGGRVGTFSGDVKLLTEDMQLLKPTCMIVVPRVVQRINDAINAKLAASGAVKRTIFNVAWHIKKFLLDHEMSTSLVDAVVFNSVKRVLGGRVTMMVNGGAALPAALHERVMVMLGVPLRTGYGLSEGGSGNTLVPRPMKYIKYGTNGGPLPNIELKIVKVPEFTDPGVGELVMGGTGLCSGYLKDKEATDALFTDETHTWIHTGDIAKWDEDNSLLIVDRMRSIFKLQQGEYVAGDLLATYFEAAPLIEHIFVYGDAARPYLVGIVIPSLPAVSQFLGKPRITKDEYVAALTTKELKDAVMEQINDVAKEKKLLGYQKVVRIALVDDEWSIENGILSPTFKAKRKVLADRYKTQIEELYNQ